MLQSLRNRRNRKGFTLAELLIVVAIIAVLVAIAVPLFVGSLNKAEEATQNANIRAVRGTAAVYLLEKSGEDVWYTTTTGGQPETTTKTPAKGWTVTAKISSSGDITGMTVTAVSTEKSATTGFEQDTVTESDGTFTVKLYLGQTEVKNIPAA